jgi:CRISP-associated protein Cas1
MIMSKRLLNTLYVTTQESYVRKEGDTVVVEAEDRPKAQFPLLALGAIVCFGNIRFSPFLLGACAKAGVSVSFLTESGAFLASVCGPVHGNVLVRREQYRRADDANARLVFARAVAGAKVANARNVLLRAARDADEGDAAMIQVAAERMGYRLREMEGVSDVDGVRGLEGGASGSYFEVFDLLISGEKPAFSFADRNRRPPTDRVNALLSFVYTLAGRDIGAALDAHGVDPQVGLFHTDRPGRSSLAQDILEEFRAPLADRLVLTLVNRKQVQAGDFDGEEGGEWRLTEEGRKTVLTAYQLRKQEEILHPFLGETMPIGLVFHAQALLFSRWLRGDLDAYPPFLWR